MPELFPSIFLEINVLLNAILFLESSIGNDAARPTFILCSSASRVRDGVTSRGAGIKPFLRRKTTRRHVPAVQHEQESPVFLDICAGFRAHGTKSSKLFQRKHIAAKITRLKDCPLITTVQFINQSADALASSHFDVRARAEFSTLPLATSYTPAVVQFTTPKVVSVDSGNIRKPSFGEYDTKDQLNKYIKTNTRRSYISSHDQYSVCMTSQGVTFGHRPNSAARMFDYLSDSVGGPNSSKRVCNKLVSRQFTSTPVRTGMSVMTLEHLLSSKKAANPSFIRKTRSIKAFGGETLTTFANSCEGFALVANESKRLDDIKKKKHELGLEKGFVNHVYNPQRGLKSVEYPPPDQTAAQLIDKYRKLAVGKQPRI